MGELRQVWPAQLVVAAGAPHRSAQSGDIRASPAMVFIWFALMNSSWSVRSANSLPLPLRFRRSLSPRSSMSSCFHPRCAAGEVVRESCRGAMIARMVDMLQCWMEGGGQMLKNVRWLTTCRVDHGHVRGGGGKRRGKEKARRPTLVPGRTEAHHLLV